jgi:hypothetical protein
MAALGLEVAQYNAAYILSKLHCPVMMTTPTDNKVNSRKGGVRGGAAAEGYNHRFEEVGEVEKENEVSYFVYCCYYCDQFIVNISGLNKHIE